MPALLQAGAMAGGCSPDQIRHADDEQAAARMAIAHAGKDSLVALLVGSGRGVMQLNAGSR